MASPISSATTGCESMGNSDKGAAGAVMMLTLSRKFFRIAETTLFNGNQDRLKPRMKYLLFDEFLTSGS